MEGLGRPCMLHVSWLHLLAIHFELTVRGLVELKECSILETMPYLEGAFKPKTFSKMVCICRYASFLLMQIDSLSCEFALSLVHAGKI